MLALKIYRNSIASETAPQIQFRALERCQSAQQNSARLRAPTPYAFLKDEKAILMDWLAAPNLHSRLWQLWFSRSKRLDLVEASGAWLRAFHDLSCISYESFEGNKLLAKLNSRTKNNQDAAAALQTNKNWATAFESFEKKASEISSQSPHALLHGDFTPSNVLADERGIIGIDMWGARHAPVFEDAARILTYLAINSPFSLSSVPLHSDGPLVSAFARGYGTDVLDTRSPAWIFTLLYQQLRRGLVYQQSLLKKRRVSVAHWQMKQTFSLIMQSQNLLGY